MAFKEDPSKQKAISRAVALNNACVFWGRAFHQMGFSPDYNPAKKAEEHNKKLESFILPTADIFYEWLSKKEIEPPTEQDKQVISEVTEHFTKPQESDKPTKPDKLKPTPPPQTHIKCTQCGTLVKMGGECPRCALTDNPWKALEIRFIKGGES